MTRSSATRIVATLGPASDSRVRLRQLVRAGVDVFRCNMSHGTAQEHAERVRRVRAVSDALGVPIGILVDLQGPKIRTAANAGGARLRLRTGARLSLGQTGLSTEERLVIPYPKLFRAVRARDRILLDDGSLALRVDRVGSKRRVSVARPARAELAVTVLRGGSLKERAGVNVPGRALGVRVPTRKDVTDVALALRLGADFLALSFVQNAGDLRRLRGAIARLQTPRPSGARTKAKRRDSRRPRSRPEPRGPLLIAKIEKPSALADLDAILEEADGVMVARGDLGVEITLEKVPSWRKEILRRARARGVFSITATQMLESMIEQATPTRAEVSDVANAVLDGTDALMLSAESAIGRHPVQSVAMLRRISEEAERSQVRESLRTAELLSEWHDETTARIVPRNASLLEKRDEGIEGMVLATIDLAVSSRARCILCFTRSGRTGFLLARHRVSIPIVCLTPHEATRRRLTLAWNTRSLLVPKVRNVNDMMRRGLSAAKRARFVRAGDTVVLLGGASGVPEGTNLLRWIRV